MNTFVKIIKSIVAFPLAMAFALLVIPFYALYTLVKIPSVALDTIWLEPSDQDRDNY